MQRSLKIITALGDTPDLVLQFIDFFNGSDQRRYKKDATIIRGQFTGQKLIEVYLLCTKEKQVQGALKKLRQTVIQEYPALAGHIHEISLSCNDIACVGDDETMRQLVYESVQDLAADDLIIGSGGRKPVTQRLIEAGLLYGCCGYLTITAGPGKQQRESSLYFNILWTTSRRFSEERRARIIKEELGDNFRSLYLLPLTLVNLLRKERIGINPAQKESDLAWLSRLPKTDLHCHLGGAYDANLLKGMAANLLDELMVNVTRRAALRSDIEQTAGKPLSALTSYDLQALRQEKDGVLIAHGLQNLDFLCERLKEPKHICVAVLTDGLTIDQIEEISRNGRALDDWPRYDLNWYMACGDLGGSALLQTEGNLRHALCWLMEEGKKENACFQEVRFSPDNYTRAGLSIPQIIETLLDEASRFMRNNKGFHINFLIMATRHKESAAMATHVAAAIKFGNPSGQGNVPCITGFDLAGQEKDYDPMQFQDMFMPLHQHFMNITIHAGEMEEDDKIWQAIYLLHARRIGHGLKLINNNKMMGYVRDHSIAIEMCPSSNIQTNGFRRFDRSEAGDTYPLKHYLDFGLRVTINTDNRGISATTLSNEYLEAARMTEGGLSRWEILRLVKNGFKASFLPKDEKDRLLKRIDEEIFSLVLDDFFPEEQT